MIGILLFIAISVLLIIRFEQTFVFIIVFSTFLQQVSSVSVYLDNIFISLSIISLFVFIIKQRNYKRIVMPREIKVPLIIIASSLFFSTFLTPTNHPAMLVRGMMFLSNIIIFWRILLNSTRKTVSVFVRLSVIFAIIISLYSVFEMLTGDNFFIRWANEHGMLKNDTFIEDVRFGMRRCQSIFYMHTTSAAEHLVYFNFILYLFVFRYFKKGREGIIVILLLLIVGLFLTGTRSAILCLFLSALSFVKIKKIRIHHILLGVLVFFVLYHNMSEYLTDVIDSIKNTDSVAGSSSDMRSEQLLISLSLMSQNPIFGNGLQYAVTFVNTKLSGLAGAESMWFPIMIDQGIYGIIAYISFICGQLLYIIRRGVVELIFFVFSIFLYNTMTSIPCFEITYIVFYILVLLAYKKDYVLSYSKIRK